MVEIVVRRPKEYAHRSPARREDKIGESRQADLRVHFRRVVTEFAEAIADDAERHARDDHHREPDDEARRVDPLSEQQADDGGKGRHDPGVRPQTAKREAELVERELAVARWRADRFRADGYGRDHPSPLAVVLPPRPF